jgi:hypothetical protein
MLKPFVQKIPLTYCTTKDLAMVFNKNAVMPEDINKEKD